MTRFLLIARLPRLIQSALRRVEFVQRMPAGFDRFHFRLRRRERRLGGFEILRELLGIFLLLRESRLLRIDLLRGKPFDAPSLQSRMPGTEPSDVAAVIRVGLAVAAIPLPLLIGVA